RGRLHFGTGSVIGPEGGPSMSQRKLSRSTVESRISSPMSQIAKRSWMVSPGAMLACVVSQLVAARSGSSNPVPESSAVPKLHKNGLPPGLVAPTAGSHTCTNALLTLTGFPTESNEMLWSCGMLGSFDCSSATKKSLYFVQT